MRKVIEYQCEKCGARYKSEEEARECESYHITPKIIDCDFFKHCALPEYIIIADDADDKGYKYKYEGLASDTFRD